MVSHGENILSYFLIIKNEKAEGPAGIAAGPSALYIFTGCLLVPTQNLSCALVVDGSNETLFSFPEVPGEAGLSENAGIEGEVSCSGW